MDKNFPSLFKKASSGAIQQWDIGVSGSTIITRWGQVNGQIQETKDEVKKGKNIGKANETTPAEQAMLEAEAKWTKQLKKGYVKTLKEAQSDAVDEIIEGGVSPMLAHRFDEQGHKISYPAFAQPKFDGHRCIAVIEQEDGAPKVSLWSRTRKPITGLPHLVEQLKNWAYEEGITKMVLDGELYNHHYRDRFEELTSYIRNPEPKAGHEVVQYHIYDIADSDLKQEDRVEELRSFYRRARRWKDSLVFVETITVADEDELMAAFSKFLEEGYEGLMVRNAAGRYANKRSYDLQKVKEFKDAEFRVKAVEEGRGKLAGHAIFVCETEKGDEFRAKMKGETSKLKEYFDHPEKAVNKMLTVKFQGMTAYGVPRFPVGLRFREEL